MTTPVYIYIAYTIISIAMTAWVARTLYKNGRIFLVDAFGGNEKMADSVNHLLVLGAMHFFNIFNFDRMRKKGLNHNSMPPVLSGVDSKPWA